MKSVRAVCFRAAVFLLAVGLSFSFANAATNQILTGQVLAGSIPIKRATVTLYGTVYACVPDPCVSASKPVEETTTDAEGRFSFDLSKAHTKVQKMVVPGSQDNLTERELPEKEQAPQAGSLFVVASGGDAGKGDNPAIKLVTALGSAPREGRVTINELTTAVAVFPLNTIPGGFAPKAESLVLACQLEDPVMGRLRPVFDRGANSPALVNTLADILHGCVTSAGPKSSECESLFKVATTERWLQRPDNTLQAMENIVSTWGHGQSSAFALLPKELPYTPVLERPPAGWLLSLNMKIPGLHRPTQIFADWGDRTLWILNRGNDSLVELSTEPKDLAAPVLGERKLPPAVRTHPVAFSFPATGFDYGNNDRPQPPGWFSERSAWLVDDKLIFLKKDGSLCGKPLNNLGLKDAEGIASCFLSGGDDLCIANAGTNEIVVVKQPDDTRCDGAKLLTKLKDRKVASPDLNLAEPAHLLECNRNLPYTWITNRANRSVSVYRDFDPRVTIQAGTPLRGGGLAEPEDLACDRGGGVWIANHARNSNSVTEFAGYFDGHTMVLKTLSPESGYSGAGLNRPYGVAVDDLGNVWVSNEGNDSLTVFIGAGQTQ